MRKLIIPLLGLFLLLTICGSLYLWLSAPQKLAEKTKQIFTEAGFEAATLPEPETKLGRVIYSDIKLDENGFSTIKHITLTASPLSLIIGSTLENITFEGIDLTGELSENGEITIAGWNGALPSVQSQRNLKARVISFENARLSLLSEKWGGITIQGDMQLQPSKQNTNFQARLKGAQKQLSADAKIEGQLNSEGFWDARIELEKGKFELGAIKASRLAGLLNISAGKGQEAQIVGELQAGGLSILNLPWQNGALTIDGILRKPRMIVAAKSSGYEGLELGLTMPNIRFPQEFLGQIHVEQLTDAFDYLESHKLLPVKRKSLSALEPFTSIMVQFAYQNNLMFKINNRNKDIDINGKIDIKHSNTYEADFNAAPTPVSTLPGLESHVGTYAITGSIDKNPEALNGEVEIKLTEAHFNYGAVPISNLNASVNIDKLKTLSGPPRKNLHCSALGLNPAISCSVSLQFKNGQPHLSALTFNGPGLRLNVPHPPKTNDKTFLSAETIDIKDLFDTFKLKTWDGAGLLTGTFYLQNENDVMSIDKLHLKNQGVGILKLTDDRLFDLMDMEELERETMKLALENFHYDLLEIKASGTFPDQVKISVFGKGKNPGLMQGRTFSLDFEITPDLSPTITKLFKSEEQP